MEKDYIKITETTKKTSEILADLKSLCTVWSYYSDEDLDKQFPPPTELTTHYFKNVQEADEEFKNLSANDLKEKFPDKKFITLRERLLLEIEYFKQTGNNLDVDNWTLCAGSRYTDGDVPDVGWSRRLGDVGFGFCLPDNSRDVLRSREVFLSPNPFPLSSLTLKPKKVKDKDVAPVEIVYKNRIYRIKD